MKCPDCGEEITSQGCGCSYNEEEDISYGVVEYLTLTNDKAMYVLEEPTGIEFANPSGLERATQEYRI